MRTPDVDVCPARLILPVGAKATASDRQCPVDVVLPAARLRQQEQVVDLGREGGHPEVVRLVGGGFEQLARPLDVRIAALIEQAPRPPRAGAGREGDGADRLFQAQRRRERRLGVVPPMQGRRQHAEEAIGGSGDVDAPGHDDELTPEGRQQLGELGGTAFVVQSAGDLGELTPDAGGD